MRFIFDSESALADIISRVERLFRSLFRRAQRARHPEENKVTDGINDAAMPTIEQRKCKL